MELSSGETSYNFTSQIADGGTYTFKVRATGDATYGDSQETVSDEYQFVEQTLSAVKAAAEAELAALCETNLNVTLLFNYAVFAERRGESELAARLYAAVLRSVPEYYDCVLREAKLLVAREQAAEAEAKLKALCDELEKQLAAGVGACARA